MKFAIIGRHKDTANYEAFLSKLLPQISTQNSSRSRLQPLFSAQSSSRIHPLFSTQNPPQLLKQISAQNIVQVFTTLSIQELSACDAVILPGGGDIDPSLFGQSLQGARNIDKELDKIQLQAALYCVRHAIPLLGICKGMQVINVALGGTLTQDLPTASLHCFQGQDQYHDTIVASDSLLHRLYGTKHLMVNSAHHQGIAQTGQDLIPIQWAQTDGCVEAIVHRSLPLLGLQWHPERLNPARTSVSGTPILGLLTGKYQHRFSEEQ